MSRNNTIKFRKPTNINIGMIIFGIIFLYLAVCVVIYFKTSHIVRYEVKEGSLVVDNVYTGVCIREEVPVYSVHNGYVNYYAQEGSRVAKEDLVYVCDETGRLNEELENLDKGDSILSKSELKEFRSDIETFAHGFSPVFFGSTYDFKSTILNSVLKLATVNMLDSIEDLNNLGINSVQYLRAPESGIAVYWQDGLESLTPETVTESTFDRTNYDKKRMISNSIVSEGDFVYKLSTNENWSLVIPMEPVRASQLKEEEYIKVRFIKNQTECWGKVDVLNNGDGKTYLELSFTNSMITFLHDRFLDVELIVEDEIGLKIPVSSIVQKEFFLIPEQYVFDTSKPVEEESTTGEGTQKSNSTRKYIMKQVYNDDGTVHTEIIEIDVYDYNEDAKEYYVNDTYLSVGDTLHTTDKQAVFSVSKRATLVGVYNMNKGYADFKRIHVLYQNDEYAIVKPDSQYGLRVYDYIVLNADNVKDNQFINQK